MSDVVPYNNSYGPMAQSQLDSFSYYSAYPGAPGGAIGQAIAGVAGSYVMGQYGHIPVGMGYGGNMYSSMRQQMFSQSHMQAMQQASQADIANAIQFQRGFLKSMGMEVTAQGEKNLQAFNTYMSNIAPIADPYTWNALNGGRSGAVMAHGVHLGGMFRRDAATGFQGMSGATSAHVAGGLYQNYFSDPFWQYKTAGFDSLGMSEMFDEATRRGLMPGIGSERQRVVGGLDYIRRNGGDVAGGLARAGIDPSKYDPNNAVNSLGQSLTDDEIKKLAGDQDVQAGMRSTDTGRIIQTLDKYKGALAAVREIFGDAGRPNAPMRELFNMLDQITQGATHQVDSGRMEMMVRNMHNAAKSAGLNMNEMMAVFGAAGRMTDQIDKNPMFATQVATGGMAFMTAYNNLGLGAVPAWGMQSNKQMAATYMKNYTNAINSSASNRLATAMRLNDLLGGEKGFGGQIGDLVLNAKMGVIRPEFANIGDGDFIEMMVRDTGLDRSTVEKALRAENANDEYIHKNNLGGLVTKYLQPEEFKSLVLGTNGGAFARESYSLISGVMGDKNVSGKLVQEIAEVAASSLTDMGAALQSDAVLRGVRMSSDIEAHLRKADPNSEAGKLWAKLSAMSPEERAKTLQTFAATAFTEADNDAISMGMEGGLIPALRLHAPTTTEETGKVSADVKTQSVLAAMASGEMLGGSPIMDLMKAIQEGGEDPNQASLHKYVAKVLGGKDKGHLAAKLSGDLYSIYTRKQELEGLKGQATEAAKRGDFGLSRELTDKYEAEVKSIGEAEAKITEFMQVNGLAQEFGTMVDEAKDGAGGGMTLNNANINITAGGATISLNGANGGTGGAKGQKRGGSPVPASN